MPIDKGKCKHGEFILTEGCPLCMAEEAQKRGGDEPDDLPGGMPPHTPYYLANGASVPSVTTVLNELNKGEGLTHWAWNCGRQGIDYRDVRDAAARVGTMAHCLIAGYLKGQTREQAFQHCKVVVAAPEESERAEQCLTKYLAWEKEHSISPVIIETPFVSEEYWYGGTPDLLADVDGEFVLVDFKTGSRIFDSHYHQLAAYWKLIEEQGWPIARAWILRLSPGDDGVEVGIELDLARDWQIFQFALGIYQLREGLNET
jgi:hypothetical protein